jgi:WD40 repeat protein
MSVAATPLLSPYKGLAPFEDSDVDALLFFGRGRETEVIVANLLAAKLTVLYGPSGVGKSSILRAAVARRLREEAPDAEIVLLDEWAADPHVPQPDGETFYIFDQFEEYFLYHDPGPLRELLPTLLERPRTHLLLALREDALARLDAFQAGVPGVFANRLRLDQLDTGAARAAIVGPLDRWNAVAPPDDNIGIESALVDEILRQVESRPGRIEAPYLQLVLERVWDEERRVQSRTLRLATLEQLGGAGAIVSAHLERALSALPPREAEIATGALKFLVTPSRTKIAHSFGDLVGYTNESPADLQHVLEALASQRILRAVPDSEDDGSRYEIFHDVLAEPVLAWRRGFEERAALAAATRRHRRLAVITGGSLLLAIAMVVLAVFALAERSHARSQAHHSEARELLARSLQQLGVNPHSSVRLALAAARLEPGGASETVLRTALNTDRLRLLVHVPGRVTAVATSSSGRRIAAAVADGRVRVLDAASGRAARTIATHHGIASVWFADDSTLLTARTSGLATAWNLDSGRGVARGVVARGVAGDTPVVFRAHGRLLATLPRVQRLAATPDGALAAAAVEDALGHVTAFVFDRHGRLLRALPGIGVSDLEFSRDGKALFVASADGRTTMWNPRAGSRIRVFAGTDPAGTKLSSVNSIAVSPDGGLLATGSDDSAVRIFDVATGERRYFFPGHTNPVTRVAWSPDGRVVASASNDRTLRLWRVQKLVEAGSMAATLAGHAEAVRAVSFARDGATLVSGGNDATVRVWDASPDEELRLLARADGPYLGARWTRDGVVAVTEDSGVQVLDPVARRTIRTFAGGSPASAFDTAGGRVALGGNDGATTVWAVASGRLLSRVAGPAAVIAVALSPDGKLAASGDRRGVIRLWDARTGRLRWSVSQQAEVTTLAFSPDGREVASGAPDGGTVWSVSGRRPLHRLRVPRGIVRIVYSPSGALIASANFDGTVRLWFAGTGRPYRVLRGHRAAVNDVVFSADGRLLASAAHDADGRVWNVDTGRLVHLLRGQSSNIAAIAISPDRQWLATAGPISAIVWPAATGRLLFYLRDHTAALTSVAFSPDGRTILSASVDGTVRTFDCEVCVSRDELIRLAERRLRAQG